MDALRAAGGSGALRPSFDVDVLCTPGNRYSSFEEVRIASDTTDLDGVDVDGEDACSVVREQCSQRTADNLRPVRNQSVVLSCASVDALPVDHCNGLAICTVSVREDLVIHSDMLKAFYDGERSTG